ncbi:MAG: hypothetical protein HZB14_01775 [Actinobacteria bacterium]|nr:hypothetical protein [Actinomycetota bacterium]
MRNGGISPRAVTAPVIALALVFAIGLSWPAPAGAARTRALPDRALRELPDTILERWRESQLPGGNFARPSGSEVFGGYGNGALAYAMLLEAARGGDDAYFRSSMRAYSWLARKRIHPQGVFFRMFVAAGYNLARRRFADRPEFKAIRSAWATRLRRFKYDDGKFGGPYRYNKNVVEAVEVLELLGSGLRSDYPKAILRHRSLARARVLRLLRVEMPKRSSDYSVWAGAAEGWHRSVKVSDFSDPPDNPPAYDALVASMYARAYALLPKKYRNSTMRDTARALLRGVIARTAPDGDLAFAGRSQEESWALTSAMHAAWYSSSLFSGADREVVLAYARRVRNRIDTAHVTDSEIGFYLTPAQSCCGTADRPPGQDLYFDLPSYAGLTALTIGWALIERPPDWAVTGVKIPTDNPSTYHFPTGRGRFLQHRGNGIYWMLREQGDFADARADMAVAVFKARREDGSWADVVPPRPFSGGHHRPADPASPCLAFGEKNRYCAYLELHGGHRVNGSWRFTGIWRTARRTQVASSTAWVTPTAKGLKLSWTSPPGRTYKIDNFLPAARCRPDGVASPGVVVGVSGQSDCRVIAKDYAGGARTDLDRVRSVAFPSDGTVSVEYTTTL